MTGSGNGIVRVSDGKGNSVIIPDHGAGVTVTPAGPGHVTISNGVDSRTVSGIALTISGAKTVSVDKSLGTGRRQADGSTTVLTPNGTVTGGVLPGSGFNPGARPVAGSRNLYDPTAVEVRVAAPANAPAMPARRLRQPTGSFSFWPKADVNNA